VAAGVRVRRGKCEQVLFMLMLERRCEGGHVDPRAALTILGYHIIGKAKALGC